MRRTVATWLLLLTASALPSARGAGQGDTVVVVYNKRLPESKGLAEYYAEKRQVPAKQVFGFDLPTTEAMTRAEFRDGLQKPLLKALEDQRLLIYKTDIIPATREKTGDGVRTLHQARIRYAVLCYGVPLIIQPDPSLKEEAEARLPTAYRRNEAAVDSELALLPLSWRNYLLAGPLPNPFYGATNNAVMHAANGVLMVARLDGPSVAIARGLIDRALEAETNGFWGRAYFDVRGLTNTNYKLGDDWIREAARVARRQGFEMALDENAATLPASFPLSQVALYAGWYDTHVSGPFTRPSVEFMPGAIAYHLHSYSAQTLRTTNAHWVGPLLAKGVTATLGCVAEPYLDKTPDVSVLFARLFNTGFSFGEAAYAAITALSWQTTVVGDPLYRPFGASPQLLHQELLRRHSKLIEWSHLRIVALNQATDLPGPELIAYLEHEPATRQSAVLQEKLGDLQVAQSKLPEAIRAYTAALQLDPTPQQKVRLSLTVARVLTAHEDFPQAVELYERFLKETPDYPDPVSVYQKLIVLAKKLGQSAEVERYAREIEGHSTAAGKP